MNTMLDSVRIKTKLVVIYLITVLLSIGFLAVFYIRSITEDTKKIAYESMERNAQYVANSVSDLIANAFLISENLELDNTIEDFFSQRKQDYESYREVINTLQDFLAIHSNCISGIFYYSTARTYSSAGTLNYIEDVSALSAYDWGEEFLNSGKNILLVYSENVLQKKHLSIIRYSFSSNRSFDCVLKLDLNFSMIQSMLRDGGLNDYEYLAEFVQDAFMADTLRVYTSPDPVGAELGAALKNVIALCAGITDGLGFGDNAKAMLMTRGLTETARLGVALGAKKETFAGLAGVGDLIVTCTSMHSRNRRAGILIGQGKDPQTAMKEVGAVVEGYYAAKSAYELGKAKGIDMPITDAAYKVLYEGADVKDAVQALLSRQRKSESEDAGWQ